LIKRKLSIKLVEEGNKYYFGNIKFLGNTVYTDQGLSRVLGVKKEKPIMVFCYKNCRWIKTRWQKTYLYKNNGYLFSNINAEEL
jgi:outer membrane protein insertion porin family